MSHSGFRMITVALLMFFTLILFGETSMGGLQQAEKSREIQRYEDARNTIAIINHINYLYVMLKTYNNICVLQDEYDKLSLKSIDPTKIPSRELTEMVNQTMKTLADMKMSEDEYAFYKEMLEDDKMAERRKLMFQFLLATPNAIMDGLKSGTESAKRNGHIPAITVSFFSATGKSLLKDTIGSVADYQKRLEELRRRHKEFKFELDKKKFAELDNYNREMFEKITSFAREFGLAPNEIVNGQEVEELISLIKKSNHQTIFKNLCMEQNKRHFSTFPMFWFYLATTAVEFEEYAEAIAAAERFEKVDSGFIKIDEIRAYVAIAKTTAMIALGRNSSADDRKEIERNLEIIQYDNMNDKHPDWSYLCASVYYEILGNSEKAKKILGTLIANLEGPYQERLTKYCDLFSKKEISLVENPIPIESNLLRARVLYKNILQSKKDAKLLDELMYMCNKNTISSTEKLYYVGDVRVSDLWKMAEKDVMEIKLYYKKRVLGNELVLDVPINWFLLGDVKVTLTLLRGNNNTILSDMLSKRTIRKNDNGQEQSYVRLRFKCPKEMLNGVEALVLDFPHESWPVRITYKPGENYSFQDAGYKDENTPFISTQIDFMGMNTKELSKPAETIKETILQKQQKKYTSFLLPFAIGKFEMKSQEGFPDDFMPFAEITPELDMLIHFVNKTTEQGEMEISISCFNEYGACICHQNMTVKLTGKMDGVCPLPWPSELKGCGKPAYVLFQYHVSEGLWDKYKNWKNKK